MTFSLLQKKIGITFKNQDLLKNAFVHRSYLNEHKNFPLTSNEKLEFLGDSVLSLVTSCYLYKNFPNFSEGIYTDIKASIVRTESLSDAAHELGLGDLLLLSKGEAENNGRENKSILADCFEALLGAIFLEKGFSAAYSFVLNFLFSNRLEIIIEEKRYLPAKNKLQEYYQNKYKKTPVYKVLSEKGPQHNKQYVIGVYYNDIELGKGKGKSKKEAEEEAAKNALSKLKI